MTFPSNNNKWYKLVSWIKILRLSLFVNSKTKLNISIQEAIAENFKT